MTASTASTLPFIRFHLTEELHAQALDAVKTIAADPKPTEYSGALADLIVELVEHGFDFYFSEPLRQAEAGFVINKTADVGLSATQKMMAPVIRNVIAKLDNEQLRTICVFIQQIMAPELK